MLMTPGLRNFALTAHVVASVGLLGSIATFLALAIAALASPDAQVIRAAYPAMDFTARLVIVPLAFASLFTGFVQSVGTRWGLFRHYWIVTKLVLTVFATTVLLLKLEMISHAARLAAEVILPRAELYAVGVELAVHAAGGLLVLLAATALSVYKPRGLTPFGRSTPREMRSLSRRRVLSSQHRRPNPARTAGISVSGEWITVTAPRAYVLGLIVIVLISHLIVLHLSVIHG